MIFNNLTNVFLFNKKDGKNPDFYHEIYDFFN